MNIELKPMEARVIGCLIEKQITTPDQYPLSLNALTNACNQKSNRDPVMDVAESVVQSTLDSLSKKHFILERSGFGSRVPKYQHRFCNTEFGTLKFTPVELAIIVELLLRGPQTPGELRTRASRMATVNDAGEIEAALETLRTREDGPFVIQLARQPGRRDSQWAHLFSGPIAGAPEQDRPMAGGSGSSAGAGHSSPSTLSGAPSSGNGSPAVRGFASAIAGNSAPAHASSGAATLTDATRDSASLALRVEQLEAEVRELRAQLAELKQLLT